MTWPDLLDCRGGLLAATDTCICRRPKEVGKAWCCGLCAGGRHSDVCTFRSVRLGMGPAYAQRTHFYSAERRQ